MTSLSDLNIVVQQSGGAKAIHKHAHALHDHSQLAAGHQRVKEDDLRTTVQSSEDSKRTQLEKESPDKRKERRRADRSGRKTREKEAAEVKEQGNFVNTVA